MVLINNRFTGRNYAVPNYEDLVFKYILEVRNSNCVFFSAREKTSGKSRLFLAFNNRSRIYTRNGIKSTWEEITDFEEHRKLYKMLAQAVKSEDIPRFVTHQLSLQHVR